MTDRPTFRCGLDITGTEFGEWQGVMRTDDEIIEFRSVLELLQLIRAKAGPPLHCWNDQCM